jgi:hypothetical protein
MKTIFDELLAMSDDEFVLFMSKICSPADQHRLMFEETSQDNVDRCLARAIELGVPSGFSKF